jgi:hypothetical protein
VELRSEQLALCRRCKAQLKNRMRTDRVVLRWWSEESERREGPVCARCGAAVLPGDPLEAMLAKLSELSRFGLGGDDRPLLVHSDSDGD